VSPASEVTAAAAVVNAEAAVVAAQAAVAASVVLENLIMGQAENSTEDLAVLEHKWDAKSRPYPYTTGSVFTVVSNTTTVDIFGSYVLVVPSGTFNFGDTPNQIQISGVSIESMDSNAVYVLEFSTEVGGVYTPIGALRFNRTSVQTRSFLYTFEGREINSDTGNLYARLKSTPANAIVTFSVLVRRHLSTHEHIPTSTGVFPFG
jgi:hypothetical protein